MFTPDTQAIDISEKIHRELSSYQVRAEAGKAIVVVNGTQDITKVYGTEMDYEENKKMLNGIVKAANDALRASEMAAAIAVMNSDENDSDEDPFVQARESVYTAKSGEITVEVDGTQQFTKLEGVDPKFAKDVLNAMNAGFGQSMLAMGDVLVDLTSE